MLSCWAIIPARGGSKGIPRKNLQRVGGVPLIGRTVRVARAAKRIDRVFVSTEDSEIGDVARRLGAEILDRPVELANDDTSSESALLHGLDVLEKAGQRLPEVLVFLQCTSPFVRSTDIDGTIAALDVAKGAACAISVCSFHGFTWRADSRGILRGVNHDGISRKRRQDLELEYLENGAVYAMRVWDFREARRRFCGPVAFHLMPTERSLEIDDAAELNAAQFLARNLDETEGDLAAISGVVFDFDGVMTDNKVLVSETGEEAVLCDRSDGLGIENLRKLGLRLLILSKEQNPVVSARAKKLRIDCLQGIEDKVTAIRSWADANGLKPEAIAYLGNDVNDVACLAYVGFPVVVADAHPDILGFARVVLNRRGGDGAVRELCDLIWRCHG